MATKTNQSQQEKNKDFGLPREAFKPIESEGGKWFRATAIIVSLVLSVGAGIVYWFFYHTPAADLLIETPPRHEEHEGDTPEANMDFTEDDVPTTHQYTKENTQASTLANELETPSIEGKRDTKDFKKLHATNLKKGTITEIKVPRGCYYIVVVALLTET